MAPRGPGGGAGQRAYVGNSINLGNRSIQYGSQSYRPAYDRHPSFYRGYWNGNRAYGGAGGGYNTAYRGGYNNGYRGGYYGPVYGQGWGYGQGGIGLSIARLALGGYGGGYGYGNGGYGYSPIGWGLGGWGLGSLGYGSGYLSYSNPYYVANANSIYNYAQPIPVAYSQVAVVDPAVVNPAMQTADDLLNEAVLQFQANDYAKALDIVDRGIRQYPDDSVLHEFRALVLFANQDYQQAAGTIHSVLAVGPGWNWTTLSGLYGEIELYTTQLRALEAYARQRPQDSAARFLLAYHYMVGGHNEAGATQLRQVVRLTPTDRVAADLLKMVAAPTTVAGADPAVAPVPADPIAAIRPVDEAAMVGTWNAAREGGSQFSLQLSQDSTFKWSFRQDQQPGAQFGGKYSFEGNVLALERADGGSMVALVTPGAANGAFNFRLVGASSEDPGLNFTR